MRTSSIETSRNDWRTWTPEEKRLYLEKLDRAIERTETGAVTGPNKRQTEFLAYDGEFALYGGAAGASKTVAMLLWLLEGVEHRNFSGLFLRRTFAQLEGSPTSPIDFSFSLFPRHGGQARDGGKVWKWDNGATIRFGHMQYEESKYNYQGPAFHRVCVERMTPVLMADQTWKPISQIQLGELVQTLEGPRPVLDVFEMGRKPVVRATTDYGSSLISAQHRVLTSFGWVCPNELRSIARRRLQPSFGVLRQKSSESCTLRELTHFYSGPTVRHVLGYGSEAERRDFDALLKDLRSDSEAFVGERQGVPLPQAWSCLGVLYAPNPRSSRIGTVDDVLRHAHAHESASCVVRGCRGDCPLCIGFGDEQFRQQLAAGQARTPSQAGAAIRSLVYSLSGDRANIPGHIRDQLELPHPYNSTPLDVSEDVQVQPLHMHQAGEAELMDLSVEDACHYIVAGNIVTSNCYDELTQFSRTQFEYMFTRLRRVIDYPIPVGIRASCNPAANWVKSDLISEEAQRAIKQLSVYDPTPTGMVFDCPGFDGKFFPARVADNPAYDTQEYIDRIRQRVGAALAAQLAAGDWSAIEGAIISAEDLRYYRMRGDLLEAAGAVKDCRTCYRFTTTDTAGTSKQRAAEARGKNPSHSVTAVWDYWPEMGLFLRHVWRKQVDWPELKQAAAAIRKQWGGRPLIENAHFGPALAGELGGATLVPTKLPGMEGQVESAKYDRAIASGLITQIEEGKFWLPEVGAVAGVSAWMPEFEAELLGWTGHPDDPADQIDVCSHAANHVKSSRRRWGGVIDSKSMRVGRRG